MTFIEIGDIVINVEKILAYRAAGESHTIIWCDGQSATDGGFLVDIPIEGVTEALTEARYTTIAQDLERAKAIAAAEA